MQLSEDNLRSAAILAALTRPADRDSAMARLASEASIEDVHAAIPSLALMAVVHPASVPGIAAVIRRLSHNEACVELLDPVLRVLGRPNASAADLVAMIELAELAFPPMLTVLRDWAIAASAPEIRAIGLELSGRMVLRPLVERRPVRAANRWDEVLASRAATREDLVRVIEALADTWAFIERSPHSVPSWRNRTLDDFLDNIGDPKVLAAVPGSALAWRWLLPREEIAGLGELLRFLADWYATEPCLPDMPELWLGMATALSVGTFLD